MAKFVELNLTDGRQVFVNVRHIFYIENTDTGVTVVLPDEVLHVPKDAYESLKDYLCKI